MTILYDQFGRVIERQKAPERRPLATAPIMDSWREYVTDGLTPERLATVFKEADAGDVRRQAELFEQLEEKDGHLLCERDKRRNVILELKSSVIPASDDARDQRVAEFIEDYLDDLEDWNDSLVAMQDAVGKGYAGLELFWDSSEGQSIPQKMEFIEQKRFRFTDPAGVLRKYPLLITDTDSMGVEIPSWRTMIHQYGGKSGHPARAGIYRVAAWMVLFKHYAIKDWITFCEVYGMPLRLGKYDQSATDDDKAALSIALTMLGTDAAGLISKSTEIEFVESSHGSTASDLWKILATFANGEISKAILGQTLSAEVGENGSYAASKTHNDVRLDLLQADGHALEATIRNQLIRPLVGFNFGWDTPAPKYELAYNEDEDLKEKADWLDKVTGKVAVGAKWYREQFHIPEPEEGEALTGGMAASAVPQEAKMRVAGLQPEAQPGDVVDLLSGQLAEDASMDAMVEQVKELLESSADLESFRDALLDMYEDMEVSELAAAMQRAMALAEMSGRFDGNL